MELTPAVVWLEQQLKQAIDQKASLEEQVALLSEIGAEAAVESGKGAGEKGGKGGTGWLNKASEMGAAYGLGLWDRCDDILEQWRRNAICGKRIKMETKRLSLLSGNARPLALPSRPPPEPPHKPSGSPGVWWERAGGP